ncbi:hypothetical protein BJ508DRAFT_141235 [Ascobolus immersus RN42]|uniref:F-box domain-containing protein n=1 Tax=Ascobolus immersus RN42 TaxID=1160509 RepID=A0A3N4I204_ASCIM|nr:hypothetical protein BJ508DRAFT_141235 [Ascobolus immersus RN42]
MAHILSASTTPHLLPTSTAPHSPFQSTAPPMPSSTSPFLLLPTEIRLMIYAHCTILTLLQLTATSATCFTEINSYPSIIRTARGFRPYGDQEREWTGLLLANVGEVFEDERCSNVVESWCRRKASRLGRRGMLRWVW